MSLPRRDIFQDDLPEPREDEALEPTLSEVEITDIPLLVSMLDHYLGRLDNRTEQLKQLLTSSQGAILGAWHEVPGPAQEKHLLGAVAVETFPSPGALLGALGWQEAIHPNFTIPKEPTLYLRLMATAEIWQGQGLAFTMTKALIAKHRPKQIAAMAWAHPNGEMRAERLLNHLGMEIVSQAKDFWRPKSKEKDVADNYCPVCGRDCRCQAVLWWARRE